MQAPHVGLIQNIPNTSKYLLMKLYYVMPCQNNYEIIRNDIDETLLKNKLVLAESSRESADLTISSSPPVQSQILKHSAFSHDLISKLSRLC